MSDSASRRARERAAPDMDAVRRCAALCDTLGDKTGHECAEAIRAMRYALCSPVNESGRSAANTESDNG